MVFGKKLRSNYGSLLLAWMLWSGLSVHAQTQLSVSISSSSDDAEERGSDAIFTPGKMYLNSSDLELVRDGNYRGNQVIGLRFVNINIPQGTRINRAYIQFTAENTEDKTTNILIRGQASNNADTFTSQRYNVSSRATTNASVTWNNIPAWNNTGEAGSSQRTPELKNIVQEIVNRNGWRTGNALAFIITGTGERSAESYDGSGVRAPRLVIEFEGDGGPTPVPICNEHISCFTSINPTGQTSQLILPVSHRFQMLIQQGDDYTNGGGRVPGNNDFTGYVPVNGSSTNGYLSVNHENTPGGVSMLDLNYNASSQLWQVNRSQAIDFYNDALVTTTRNCSGGVTPWGTVITSEETFNSGDVNGDGYQDVGWHIEIDPVTKKVVNNQKLWALGRMRHENIVASNDRKTVYFGEDGGSSCVYKFVADNATDLSSGTLYVLDLDGRLSGGDPTSSTGKWVRVPNSTKSDRNNTTSLASSLGGTDFDNVEDVEINPINGEIYFTSKSSGRVYSFKDNGSSVNNFKTFVGGKSYSIVTATGTVSESWGGGNDNLTFDDKGNLWVLQDGGKNYIWMVEKGHTQSIPKVRLFASAPSGSEPTGMTFSPDYRFMFVSIQHPSSFNGSQTDASGNTVRFNKSSTVVISLNKDLGNSFATIAQNTTEAETVSFPNPTSDVLNTKVALEKTGTVVVELLDIQGSKIASLFEGELQKGIHEISFDLRQYVQKSQKLILSILKNGKRTTQMIEYKK